MTKQAVFTMKLESELRDAFMAEAESEHRPASQVVRELMREYLQKKKEARAYETFLGEKVNRARGSAHAGLGRSNEEVEAEFAKRRSSLK